MASGGWLLAASSEGESLPVNGIANSQEPAASRN